MATHPLPESAEALYAPYIGELQEFFAASGLQCGSPGDVFAISERMESSRPFYEDLSSLIRSIVVRQGGTMPHPVLLQIVALAVGGPQMERASHYYRQPLRRLLSYITGALNRTTWNETPAERPAGVLSFPMASMRDMAEGAARQTEPSVAHAPEPQRAADELRQTEISGQAEIALAMPPGEEPQQVDLPVAAEPALPPAIAEVQAEEASVAVEQELSPAIEEVQPAEAFVAAEPALVPAIEEMQGAEASVAAEPALAPAIEEVQAAEVPIQPGEPQVATQPELQIASTPEVITRAEPLIAPEPEPTPPPEPLIAPEPEPTPPPEPLIAPEPEAITLPEPLIAPKPEAITRPEPLVAPEPEAITQPELLIAPEPEPQPAEANEISEPQQADPQLFSPEQLAGSPVAAAALSPIRTAETVPEAAIEAAPPAAVRHPSLRSRVAKKVRFAPSMRGAVPVSSVAALCTILLMLALHHFASIPRPLNAQPAVETPTQPAVVPTQGAGVPSAAASPSPIDSVSGAAQASDPGTATGPATLAKPAADPQPKARRAHHRSIYDDGYVAPPTYHSYIIPARTAAAPQTSTH